MFKKYLAVIAAFLAVFFLWLINAVPVFGETAKGLEVYSAFNSSGKIISTDFADYKFIPVRNGESFTFNGEFNLEDFLKKYEAEIVFTESTESGFSVYAYSDEIKYRITLYGRKINVHIHFGKGQIKIGSPMIFGSF